MLVKVWTASWARYVKICRISIWNVSFLFSFCKTHYLMVSLQRSKTKPTCMCVSLWGRQEWLHQVLQCFLFSSRRSLWWPSTLVSKLLKNCLNCLKHLPCHRLVLSHVASQSSLFIIISVSLIKTTGHHLYIPIAAIPNVLGERKANLCPRSSLKPPIENSSKVQDFSFKTIDDFPHVYRKFHSQLHFMIWFFFFQSVRSSHFSILGYSNHCHKRASLTWIDISLALNTVWNACGNAVLTIHEQISYLICKCLHIFLSS